MKQLTRTFHYIYLIINIHPESNKYFYIGKRSSFIPSKEDIKYMGSGKIIKDSIKKYGKKYFKKIILKECSSENLAYELEEFLVDEEWLERKDTMNLKIGGSGGTAQCKEVRKKMGKIKKNTIAVKDKDGNKFRVDNTDPRWLSGELVGVAKGKNRSPKSAKVKKQMSESKKGKIAVKDKDGKCYLVDKNDPRWMNGELVGVNDKKVNVADKEGNIFKVSTNDPRYLSGELKSISNFIGKTNPSTKHKGKYRVIKNEISLYIDPSRLEYYKSKGWRRGNPNSKEGSKKASKKLAGNFFVTNGKANKRINSEEDLKYYISLGWRRGITHRKKI